MKKCVIALASTIIIFLNGCTSHQVAPQMSMKPPNYVEHPAQPLPPAHVNDGSAFGRGENPIFSDAKAMRVNDVVTVRINENTFQSSQVDKKISGSSNNELKGGVFGGALKGLNNITDLSLQTGSNKTFKGNGKNSRNEKFSTTITARVIKILSGGNYFIFGSRELLLNGEKQLVKISGVIRPYDIDQYNTIDSQYIADAKILYETQGDIREAVRKPWGSKIIETVWPF